MPYNCSDKEILTEINSYPKIKNFLGREIKKEDTLVYSDGSMGHSSDDNVFIVVDEDEIYIGSWYTCPGYNIFKVKEKYKN